jgi:hypothetical protein
MADNLAPEPEGKTAQDEARIDTSTEERVPFTVEMMELDNNPIILQPKSY